MHVTYLRDKLNIESIVVSLKNLFSFFTAESFIQYLLAEHLPGTV